MAASTMLVTRSASVVDVDLRMLPKSLSNLDTVMWMGKYTTREGDYQQNLLVGYRVRSDRRWWQHFRKEAAHSEPKHPLCRWC